MAGSDELRKARETVESSKSGAQVPEVDLLKARLVIATAEASVSKPSSSRKKSKPEAAPEAQAEYSEEDEDEDEADKENVEEHGSGLGQKKTRTTLPWANKNSWHFTDSLLTEIEEHMPVRVACGFSKGDGEGNTTNGKKVKDIYEDLAKKVLATHGRFSKTPLKKLTGLITTRVKNIKSQFISHRNKLGETGHGLVESGRAEEMVGDLANVFEKIMRTFPWYKRVADLMISHPTVTRKAVANSQTPVDLSILSSKKHRVSVPPMLDDDDESSSSDSDSELADTSHPNRNSSSTPDFSHAFDAGGGPQDEDVQEDLGPTLHDTDRVDMKHKKPAVFVAPPHTPTSKPTSRTPSSNKRKGMHDSIAEAAAENRNARLQAIQIHNDARVERRVKKAKLEHDAAVQMKQLELEQERMKLEHQAREAEKQRAHEVAMMEMQRDISRPGMHRFGGGPPRDWPIDPSFQ